MKHYLLLLLLVLSGLVCASNQKVVHLSEIHSSQHLAKYSIILEDKKSELRFQDVSTNLDIYFDNEHNNELISPDSDIPYMDFTRSSFWMKLEIENDQAIAKSFLIELARPLSNQIELYTLDEQGQLIQHQKSGDDLNFEDRPINYRKFIFPVEFAPNSKTTLLVRAQSDGEILKLPVKFWDTYELKAFISKENFFLGAYYGFIILVVILFAFFGFALRQKIYFFFVSYVFVMGLFQFSLDGFAYRYLWPNSPYLGNHSILTFAAIAMLSLMAYANQFLGFYKKKDWFWTTYKIFAYLVIACLITSLTTGFLYSITYPILNGLSFIITTFFFIGIYRYYQSGKQHEVSITVAFMFLWLGAIFFIVSNVNIIESEFLATNALKIASALEITFLSISLAQRYRQTQDLKLKAEKDSVERLEQINQLKSEQTELLEKQVQERTQEIVKQKDKLASQNEDIIQSITYAKRLQSAILPSKKLLESQFRDVKVFFQPKDIVSGDFYWVEFTKKYVFFAVADCTGHGVPGAMVSVVGHNALNRCINEIKLTDTGEVLDTLTDLVEYTFSQKGNTVSDGMDIALCRWDYKNELMYSGAYNPLLIIKNGELQEIKANRQPVGKFIKREPFKTNLIEVESGMAIYLFSDGYIDQFGGKEGKKLKSKAFKQILLQANQLGSDHFEAHLGQEFISWKGEEEQIDDICVMQVKF